MNQGLILLELAMRKGKSGLLAWILEFFGAAGEKHPMSGRKTAAARGVPEGTPVEGNWPQVERRSFQSMRDRYHQRRAPWTYVRRGGANLDDERAFDKTLDPYGRTREEADADTDYGDFNIKTGRRNDVDLEESGYRPKGPDDVWDEETRQQFREKGVTQLGVREYLARRMGMMDEWQKLLKEEEADTD